MIHTILILLLILGGNAMTTIAKLHPIGLTVIDLMPAGDPASENYVLDEGTLDLHEGKREELAYSGGANVDGGEFVSSHGPLTPITFDAKVHGSGADVGAARAQMIQRIEDLGLAVQAGGYFQYRPAGMTCRPTYYHYEPSKWPQTRKRTMNNWDAPRVEAEPLSVCAMELEVFLQTQPFATSDPATPVVVKTATTVYNQDDGVAGSVTIDGDDIKGSVGALTQLRIRNLESGAWKAISRLFYARRTEGLDNFDPILEGGTPDTASSIHWSTESDNSRRSNNYQRYKPPEAANDLWAWLSYTLSNPTDHEGRAAVVIVCRNMSESKLNWDLKASFEVGDVEVETPIVNTERVGAFHIIVLGEIDIPPTPISADESYAPVVKLYLRRTSGEEAIDIDFADLLFVDEYPQQVDIEDGFTDSYRLLLENYVQELCHIVAQATLAFEKTAQALCPLLQLKPGVDNRLDFLWESTDVLILEDGFEDYEAWYWLPIADFESDESWQKATYGTVTSETSNYKEGEQAVRGTTEAVLTYYSVGMSLETPLDLSAEGRFGDDDYVVIPIYASHDDDGDGFPDYKVLQINFYDSVHMDYFQAELDRDDVTSGWNFVKLKKTDFVNTGDADWASISQILIRYWSSTSGAYCIADDWRIVKADPDDATKGNDTGSVWDPARDVWRIEEQESADHTYGCLDNTAALEQVTLIHEEPPANIKYLAKVRAKRDDGDVGLVFRCEDGTSGSEDMAAFFIDTSNDELELRKWAAGSPSDIATAVSQVTAPDTDYYLGVQIICESLVRCYFGTTLAAIWDAENKEFISTAQVFNEADSVFASGGALAGGQCGLLSIGTLGRFDDIELYNVGEGHVPGDTIQVYLQAIFRSIYPFRE